MGFEKVSTEYKVFPLAGGLVKTHHYTFAILNAIPYFRICSSLASRALGDSFIVLLLPNPANSNR